MITDCPDPVTAVGKLWGERLSLIARRPVSGGSINRTTVLELDNGRSVFLKENSASQPGLFAAEATGIAALASVPGPRVPKPYCYFEDSRNQWLCLEHVNSAERTAGFWERFGRECAALHAAHGEIRFGFYSDNHIGITVQINAWRESWAEFFRDNRLGFQVELAERTGLADRDMVRSVRSIMERIETLLPEPDKPSLLHGDLWGGNYMVGPEGEPVIIDPAVYYGDRETDLAMARLFGGFDPRFFDAYNEAWPLPPEHRDRIDLYNLYHMLNHLNIFGRGYAGSVRSLLSRYA